MIGHPLSVTAMSMPPAPWGFRKALAGIVSVSEKNVVTPTAKQVISDTMATISCVQTAVRSKSQKIVKRKMEVSNKKGGKEKSEVLEFLEESEDFEKGFGTKLYDKLKPKSCRPSTLPGAEKLIEEFARIATDEVNSSILRKDKRKHSDLDKKLLKLFEVINNERK